MAKAPTDIRSLARNHTEAALNTLAGISSNGKSEAARVSASIALLERGWGKPVQPIAGDDENPLKIIQKIETVIVDPSAADS